MRIGVIILLLAQFAEVAWSQRNSISIAAQSDFNNILDVNIQCSPYHLNDVNTLLEKTKFPPVGQIATIPDGDTNAQDLYNTILKSGIIPADVKVKSDNDDNHASVNKDGYNATDPDCWYTASQCTQPKHQNLTLDLTDCPTLNTLGFTVGDAPNCSHNLLYDSFEKSNIKATLFYVGSNVIKYPFQAQRGITDGHDICVQSWSNPYLTTLPNDQVFAELYYTALAIKAILGITSTCWRPPFGDLDDRVRAIAYGLGLRTIMYAEDVKSEPKAYQKVTRVAANSSPIVQFYESSNETMTALRDHLSSLKDAYKLVMPITACMNITQPYAENIEYPNFLQAQKPDFKYKKLPKSTDISADSAPKYQVVPLDQMNYGFANSLNATGKNATFPATTDVTGSAMSLMQAPSLASLVALFMILVVSHISL